MVLAVSIRYGFIDEKGKPSFAKIKVPNGFSIAQYTEFAQASAQILANVSTGQVTSASISVGLDLSGATIKATALAGADIFQKALIQFNTVVAGFRARLKIPAIWENLFVAGSDQLDQTAGAVQSFVSAYEDGIVVTGGTIQPCDDRENDVSALTIAKQNFRKK